MRDWSCFPAAVSSSNRDGTPMRSGHAEEQTAFHRERHEVDARDNAFVLDQLARINDGTIASPLRGRIDLSHAFAIGHSLGGKASVVSCATDRRWSACVNLDGGLDAGDRYPRVDKPLLAIFSAPSPVKLPMESEERFRQRRARNATFLTSQSNRDLVAQYENVVAPGVIATSPVPVSVTSLTTTSCSRKRSSGARRRSATRATSRSSERPCSRFSTRSESVGAAAAAATRRPHLKSHTSPIGN